MRRPHPGSTSDARAPGNGFGSTHRTGTVAWRVLRTSESPPFLLRTLNGAHRSSDSRVRPLRGTWSCKLVVKDARRASRVWADEFRTSKLDVCGHPVNHPREMRAELLRPPACKADRHTDTKQCSSQTKTILFYMIILLSGS